MRSDDRPALPTLSDGDSSGFLGKVLAYTLVVLLLGGAGIYVARRYLPRYQAAAGRRIRVVESAFLGPRKQLHVVQVGPQRFLVASCRDRVTLISELTGSFEDAYDKDATGGSLKPELGDREGR